MQKNSLSIGILFLVTLLPTFAHANVPPEKPVLFPSTEEEVSARCDQVLDEAAKGLLEVAKLDPEAEFGYWKITFKNTIRALDHIGSSLEEGITSLRILKDISPEPEAREAGIECEKRRVQFYPTHYGRDPRLVTNFEVAVKRMTEAQKEDRVVQAVVAKIRARFKASGAYLKSQEEKDRLLELRRLMVNDEQPFQKETRKEKEFTVPADLLIDTPPEVISGLPLAANEDGDFSYTVRLNKALIYELLEKVPNEDARKLILVAWLNRGGEENIARLERLYAYRQELAELLGYENYLDYRMDGAMLGPTENAKKFHEDFLARIRQQRNYELSQFRALKRIDTQNPKAEIGAHDIHRYSREYVEAHFGVNEDDLKDYLTYERVVPETFEIYNDLYPVRLEPAEMPFERWAEDDRIQYYEAYDTRFTPERFLGEVMVDLFYRENKDSGRAFAATLRRARTLPDGTFQPARVLLMAGYGQGDEGMKGTMYHRTLKSFFHETGHLFQVLFGTPLAEEGTERAWHAGLVAGYNVRRDSIEMSSMMMENWVREPEVLKRFNPDIPDELAIAKWQSRKATPGTYWSRQMGMAAFDIWAHSDRDGDGIWAKPENVQGVADENRMKFKEFYELFRGYPYPEGARQEASIYHYAREDMYAAAYYGYTSATVYNADMWGIIERLGVMDPKIMLAYVEEFIERAAIVGGREATRNFKRRVIGDSDFAYHWTQRLPEGAAFFEQISSTSRAGARLGKRIDASRGSEASGQD